MTTAPLAPPPVPADIGLVAALGIEVAPLIARLDRVRRYSADRRTIVEGELRGKLVAAILAGPGRSNAQRATKLLIAGHRPRWVVSAGFGGALDPSLKRDDLVFATEVIDPDGPRYLMDLKTAPDPAARSFPGALATVDAIVRTAREKADLRRATGASIVDMETSAVAAECDAQGVRLIALRVVSDEADVDLPPEIAAILGRTGGYRVGAALGAIWRRPSSLKDLLALREHATSAAQRLAKTLPAVFAQLS